MALLGTYRVRDLPYTESSPWQFQKGDEFSKKIFGPERYRVNEVSEDGKILTCTILSSEQFPVFALQNGASYTMDAADAIKRGYDFKRARPNPWQFQPGDEFKVGDDFRVVVRVKAHRIYTGYVANAELFDQTPEWYREHGSNFRRPEEAILNDGLRRILNDPATDAVLKATLDEISEPSHVKLQSRVLPGVHSPQTTWTDWDDEDDSKVATAIQQVFEVGTCCERDEVAKVTITYTDGSKYQFRLATS